MDIIILVLARSLRANYLFHNRTMFFCTSYKSHATENNTSPSPTVTGRGRQLGLLLEFDHVVHHLCFKALTSSFGDTPVQGRVTSRALRIRRIVITQ